MEFGKAEVSQLDLPFGVIEDVVRLQVSVDDALGMDVG